MIQSVAVFCGSKNGNSPLFAEHAAELGKLIAMLNIRLIYGGGKKGLMGIIADAVMKHEGAVTGIIPEKLVEWEQQHVGLTQLMVVPDMHSRKKKMYEMCDAAIILAGGMGTLDELFEMITWNQLKIHDKKIYFLNSGGYYGYLIHHMKQMEKEGFLYESWQDRITFCKTPVEIFNQIQ